MKLTLRIYLAVLASLLLFVLSIVLLGWGLGGYEKRKYTQKVAHIFETQVLPQLHISPELFMADRPPRLASRLEPTQQKFKEQEFKQHESKEQAPEQAPPFNPHKQPNWTSNKWKPSKRKHDKGINRIQRQANRQLRNTLRQFTKRYHASIVILSAQGQPVRHIGRPRAGSPFAKYLAHKHKVVVAMPHGFIAHIRTHNPNIAIQNFALRFLIGLVILFLCVGLMSYPLARRISKRLEILTTSVNQWGAQGHAKLQLPNHIANGRDEIATLSQSFASASERIDNLLQANKLLLANASHEIRTPLTRIRLNIEMLEQLIDNNQQAAYKKRESAIKRNLAELDELVESILQSSRLDAQHGLVNAKRVDIYALVKQEALHYSHISLTGAPALVHGQENLLIQLVRNLIGNAYKHGKPPVAVSVTNANNQNTNNQNENNQNKNNQVILTVTDAGDGIPADKLDEIFTPFKRLSNHTKGNGLGLHLVKKIVELHGGTINVTSQQGYTCFEVKLRQAH